MELRKKLISKHFPLNIVHAVIHDFLERWVINIAVFLECFLVHSISKTTDHINNVLLFKCFLPSMGKITDHGFLERWVIIIVGFL